MTTIVTGAGAFAGQPARLDAKTGFFLEGELEKIDDRVFVQPKPMLNALGGLFPVKSDFADWQKSYSYRALSSVGKAKILDPAANDFPIVNAQREEFTTPLMPIGAAVVYDARDLAAAVNNNLNLDEALFMAARRAIEEKVNSIAFSGDQDHGLHGLLTHPGIGRLAAANAIASGTTAANNLIELNKLANSAPNNSGQVESPDIALLPPDSYQASSQQRHDTGTDTTTLSFWLGTNGYISTAQPIRELSGATILTAGTAGTSDVAVSFRRDPMVLELLFSGIQRLPIMQTGPLTYQVPFVGYCGGMVVRLPKGVLMLTGV